MDELSRPTGAERRRVEIRASCSSLSAGSGTRSPVPCSQCQAEGVGLAGIWVESTDLT